MKSFLVVITGLASFCLASFGLALIVPTPTPTASVVAPSIDADSYLISKLDTTPAWATGEYATALATALHSVETAFKLHQDFVSIHDAVIAAAVQDGGDEVVASLSGSDWNWDGFTHGWYKSNVPLALQSKVLDYNRAWTSVIIEVEAKATAPPTAGETHNGAVIHNAAPTVAATGNAAAPKPTGRRLEIPQWLEMLLPLEW